MMYEMVVSLSPKLVNSLSYDMRNEQISKTINISKGLVSSHITGNYRIWIRMVYSEQQIQIQVDQPIFKLK